MNLEGEKLIGAPRERVWAAINDVSVLQICIPGCESLARRDDGSMDATVLLKIGPIKAQFKGNVVFENVQAPSACTLKGEGQGGLAGFAKGSAEMSLHEQDTSTLLRYRASVQVGGKIAQLGARLIDGTAAKLTEKFFEKFCEQFQPVEEHAIS